MEKYNIDYFIDKVEKTKPEDWVRGEMGSNGCHCMLGHCGIGQNDRWIHNEETAALTTLMGRNKKAGDKISTINPVIEFNDNTSDGTERESWLKKLKSIKAEL